MLFAMRLGAAGSGPRRPPRGFAFAIAALARLGVVIVTVICVVDGWDTHDTRFGAPRTPDVPASDPETIRLATAPQLGLCSGLTVIAGMLGGGIVAMMERPRG